MPNSNASKTARGSSRRYRQAKETYVVEATPAPGSILTAVRLEALPDDSLPNKSLGRAFNGNFVLSAFEVRLKTSDGKTTNLPLVKAETDYDQSWLVASPSSLRRRWYQGQGKESRQRLIQAGPSAATSPENRVARKAIFTIAPTHYPRRRQAHRGHAP